MSITLESLPVELIAHIMGELDLQSLVLVAYLSRRLHHIASDPSLNPWRRPILRNLHAGEYEESLKHLSVRSIVPRHGWVEVLSIATPAYLLFEATLPNLRADEWEECFKRRFMPGWSKWKKDCGWKEAFIKLLYRVWHRSHSSCTTDEAWTKYIVLNRNGSANELEASSRSFNPLAIFNEMKLQSNLAHLETHVRLVVQFADVRVIALGVLNKPRAAFSVNTNARALLHPPGIESTPLAPQIKADDEIAPKEPSGFWTVPLSDRYWRLTHPLPALSHTNYPFYTCGGQDKRWIGTGLLEEGGREWVGGLMLTAQIVGPHTNSPTDGPPFQDLDLVVGPGRGQYASFTWADLSAIAPWMEERFTKKIDGAGLGN